jgi:hypothetical protein
MFLQLSDNKNTVFVHSRLLCLPIQVGKNLLQDKETWTASQRIRDSFSLLKNLWSDKRYQWNSVFFHSFINGTTALCWAQASSWVSKSFFTKSVGLLGRGSVIRKALSGIRTHDPSVQASEDSSCLRPRDHCDRRNSRPTLRKSQPSFFLSNLFHFPYAWIAHRCPEQRHEDAMEKHRHKYIAHFFL